MSYDDLTPEEIEALDQLEIEDDLIKKENELCEKENAERDQYIYQIVRALIDSINAELMHNMADSSANQFANQFMLLGEAKLAVNINGTLRSQQFIGGEEFLLYGAIFITNKAAGESELPTFQDNVAFVLRPTFAASFTHAVVTFQDAQKWFEGVTETIKEVFDGEIKQALALIETKKREVKSAQTERAFILRGNKTAQVW